jgi:hypothetical protein
VWQVAFSDCRGRSFRHSQLWHATRLTMLQLLLHRKHTVAPPPCFNSSYLDMTKFQELFGPLSYFTQVFMVLYKWLILNLWLLISSNRENCLSLLISCTCWTACVCNTSILHLHFMRIGGKKLFASQETNLLPLYVVTFESHLTANYGSHSVTGQSAVWRTDVYWEVL